MGRPGVHQSQTVTQFKFRENLSHWLGLLLFQVYLWCTVQVDDWLQLPHLTVTFNISATIMANSCPPRKLWRCVEVANGTQLGCRANIRAAIRWWTGHGEHQQVKGVVELQHYPGSPLFRLLYNGKVEVDGGSSQQVNGALYFPLEVEDAGVEIHHEVLESKHARAHGIRLTFLPNADGLERIQVIIPTTAQGKGQPDATAVLFRESLYYANLVRLSFAKGETVYAAA